MSGGWIPIRLDLPDDPSVLSIASDLGMDEFAVIGRLIKIWSWANRHLLDGKAAISLEWIDRFVDTPGFAVALVKAKWLQIKTSGVQFPNFDRWNSTGAKSRLLKTQRHRQWRLKSRGSQTVDAVVDGHVDAVVGARPSTKEKKRKEEKKEITDSANRCAVEIPPDPKPPKKPRAESDSVHAGFIGAFCDGWKERYGDTYPFNGGKDGAAVKWLRGQLKDDLEKFRVVVKRYLDDNSEYVVNAHHSIGLLRSALQKWLVGAPRSTCSIKEGERRTQEILKAQFDIVAPPMKRPPRVGEMTHDQSH